MMVRIGFATTTMIMIMTIMMNTFSSVSEGALCSYRVELSPRLMGLLGECSKPEVRSLLTFFHSSFLSMRLREEEDEDLTLFLSEASELSEDDDEEPSPLSPSVLSPLPLLALLSLLLSVVASVVDGEDDDVPIAAAAALAFAAAADAAAACCLPLAKILTREDIS